MSEYMDIDLSPYLSIKYFDDLGLRVTYKDFPLWGSGVPLDYLTIRIYDPTKKQYSDDPDYYMLECIDNLGDAFFYGRFADLDELNGFLDNPFSYHERQEQLWKQFFGEMN